MAGNNRWDLARYERALAEFAERLRLNEQARRVATARPNEAQWARQAAAELGRAEKALGLSEEQVKSFRQKAGVSVFH